MVSDLVKWVSSHLLLIGLATSAVTPSLAKEISTGSGFFISTQGHILTNNHVVENSEDIQITLSDGRKVNATVLLKNPLKDIAILKISGSDYKPLSLGESLNVNILDHIVVFGYPLSSSLGSELSAYQGEINAWRNLNDLPLLQMDAKVNPGASGGPVLDAKMNVIGVTVSQLNPLRILQDSGVMIDGVKFAIPIDEVKCILKGLSIPLIQPKNEEFKAPVFDEIKPSMVFIEATKEPTASPVAKVETTGKNENSEAGLSIQLEAMAFIDRFVSAGESLYPIDSEKFYHDSVSYFDEGITDKLAIIKDITDHFNRWPKRSYKIIGNVEFLEPKKNDVLVSYDVVFEVSNLKSKIEGSSRMAVAIQRIDNELKIVAIREKILTRRTTKF